MPKIALIGAGSATFSRRLLADLLSWPELEGAQFALMDVDTERLALIEALAQRMVQEKGVPATVEATTSRERALEGADYVVSTLAIGYAYEPDRPDVAIPEKYGLHQTVADTIGVGGVFRYLRTMPAMLEIGRDMQRLCPQALWLNYVNPMNMIMWTLGVAVPGIRSVGLCHSVQGTAERLAGFAGVPHEEVAYWVAGINHQAWFLQLRHHTYRGEDLYPRLWQALEQPESYDRDRVRFEVLRHFGYFVTESSRHMSEYVPWFRRTAEDRERYTPASTPDFRRPAPTNGTGSSGARGGARGAAGAPGVGGQLAAVPTRRQQVWESIKQQIAGEAPIDFKRSREYCSYIVHAVESNTPFRFNGNVPNTGLITNLPPGCNVEVPILTDGAGLHPCHVGDLPSQLAAINRTNVNVQELAVQGFLRRDREAIHQACALDPLAAATTSLSDIRSMVDELFEANARWLDGWAARAPAGAGV
ncbi:MAG TPA: alpha-galactosidase [Chloroflexota bacterium]|nr:alpha-galactosidase [Chloroflexota bacterium]